MRPPRLTAFRLMVLVAVVALYFGGGLLSDWRNRCYSRAAFPKMMQTFCHSEEEIFSARAARCRKLASSGFPSNAEGEEADTLRMPPLPLKVSNDVPWTTLAACWERAALTARQSAAPYGHEATRWSRLGSLVDFALVFDNVHE